MALLGFVLVNHAAADSVHVGGATYIGRAISISETEIVFDPQCRGDLIRIPTAAGVSVFTDGSCLEVFAPGIGGSAEEECAEVREFYVSSDNLPELFFSITGEDANGVAGLVLADHFEYGDDHISSLTLAGNQFLPHYPFFAKPFGVTYRDALAVWTSWCGFTVD